MTKTVLFVDDDKSVRKAMVQTLEIADFRVITAASVIEAKDHITPEFDGIIISDIRMPGKSGFDLLDYVRVLDPDLPVIMLTGEGDIPMAVRAIQAGAMSFLEKPCDPSMLIDAASRALSQRRTVLEHREITAPSQHEDAAARLILGRSAISRVIRSQLRRVAQAGSDALITGETGAGKDLAVQVIHELGVGIDAPFVAVNCSLLTAESCAQILFDPQTGAFARAAHGTVYLDEIGAMPMAQQAVLLRVLQDRQIMAADGTLHPITCRVVAATQEDLPAMMARGAFRADLYFRLEVARVHVPPLRDRLEDVGSLFRVFVYEACARMQLRPKPIDGATHSALYAHDWPGNMRELRNHAQRFAMGLEEADRDDLSLAQRMERIEAELIADALRQTSGQVMAACDLLGIARKTLYDKLKRHHIDPDAYR